MASGILHEQLRHIAAVSAFVVWSCKDPCLYARKFLSFLRQLDLRLIQQQMECGMIQLGVFWGREFSEEGTCSREMSGRNVPEDYQGGKYHGEKCPGRNVRIPMQD